MFPSALTSFTLSPVTIRNATGVIVAPPPLALGEWVQEQRLIDGSIELAARYRALAARLGVRFADAGAWGVGLAYDGVHFTGQGHRAFAEGIRKELAP